MNASLLSRMSGFQRPEASSECIVVKERLVGNLDLNLGDVCREV